ncbi:MAG: hypothetical protein Q4D04_01550, partial [Clostridia bacterium]|nr:hypothetical protein [Clostridia bacterium]
SLQQCHASFVCIISRALFNEQFRAFPYKPGYYFSHRWAGKTSRQRDLRVGEIVYTMPLTKI